MHKYRAQTDVWHIGINLYDTPCHISTYFIRIDTDPEQQID